MIYDDGQHYFYDLAKVVDFSSYILYWAYLAEAVLTHSRAAAMAAAEVASASQSGGAADERVMAVDSTKFVLVLMNVLVLLCAFVKL